MVKYTQKFHEVIIITINNYVLFTLGSHINIDTNRLAHTAIINVP